MPLFSLNPYLLLGLTAFVVVIFIYQRLIFPAFLSPLSKVPNAHFTAPILHTWINSKRRHGTGIKEILEAHRTLGPVVRLSPDELSVASLDGLRKIYLGGFEKTEWYTEFENLGTANMVSMLSNNPHAERKRMLSHVYSKSYLQNSADLNMVARELLKERLLPILSAAAQNGNPLDMYSLNQAIGLDFMSAYLFGIDNSTDFIRDLPARTAYIKNWRIKSKSLSGKVRATGEIESLMLSMYDAAHMSRRDPKTKMLDKQPTHPVVFSQMSSYLFKSEANSSSSEKIRQAIASEFLDQLGAAHEMGRVTLTYILWHLSQHRDLQSAVRSELAACGFLDSSGSFPIPSVPLSPPPRPGPSPSASLTILPAIITETMRLHPLVPSALPRVVPRIGTVIDGYFVPGGTKIGCAAFCLHQNENVFVNAESWNIWRWIPSKDGEEAESERLKELRRWFWGFGSGGRVCIGKHFAIWMLTMITATLYANFETEIVDDEGIEQEDAIFAGPKGERLVLRLRPNC